MGTLIVLAGLILAQPGGMMRDQCIANFSVGEALGSKEMLSHLHRLPFAEQQVVINQAREEMLKDRKRMDAMRSNYEHRVRGGMADVCVVWR